MLAFITTQYMPARYIQIIIFCWSNLLKNIQTYCWDQSNQAGSQIAFFVFPNPIIFFHILIFSSLLAVVVRLSDGKLITISIMTKTQIPKLITI